MPTLLSFQAGYTATGSPAVSQQPRPHFTDHADPHDRGHLAHPDDLIAPPPRSERYERIALCRLLEGYSLVLAEDWFFDERRRLIYWAITSTRLEAGAVDPPLTTARLNTRQVLRIIERSGLWTFASSAAHELREIIWAGESEPNWSPSGNLKSYANRRTLSTLGDWLSRASRDVFTPVDEIVHAIRATLQEVAK